MDKVLSFKGCANFRQKIVFATLSGRAVRMTDIRSDEEQTGLSKSEVSFLRLIEKITTGGVFEISMTGTTVFYRPGALVGGKFSHDCGTQRCVTWFLEGLLPLMPFAMAPLTLTLTGTTNDQRDASVDTFRTVTLPLIARFGLSEGLEFKVEARGAAPEGGGRVTLRVPNVRQLKAVRLAERQRVKRVRGIAYATRVAPQVTGRLVEGSKEAIIGLTQDLFVYADFYKGKEGGRSPGYGVALVAETTGGALISGESVAANGGELPEDVGRRAAFCLLKELSLGGCVDRMHQPTALAFMALCPTDVCMVRVGKELTAFSVQTLRLLKQFFGVIFKIERDASDGTILLTCVGCGLQNIHKLVR